jgi:hypothetical protein
VKTFKNRHRNVTGNLYNIRHVYWKLETDTLWYESWLRVQFNFWTMACYKKVLLFAIFVFIYASKAGELVAWNGKLLLKLVIFFFRIHWQLALFCGFKKKSGINFIFLSFGRILILRLWFPKDFWLPDPNLRFFGKQARGGETYNILQKYSFISLIILKFKNK